MPDRRPFLAAMAVMGLLVACGRGGPAGAVRTPMQASEIAQRTLRSAGLDEEVIDVEQLHGAWIVTTRWRETSAAGHLVTVDAASGKTRVELYRSIELGGPP